MVNILKNWMGIKKDDNLKDIPEIHLHKKEPKFYFDEKLKRWVIEGEEIEPEKAKKPPPKKVMITKDKNDKNKAKNKTKSKYANAFGDENIYTPEIKPKVENEEKNDINNFNYNFGMGFGNSQDDNDINMYPLGKKFVEKNNVADIILFLASDEASFITGEIIQNDNGYSINHGMSCTKENL